MLDLEKSNCDCIEMNPLTVFPKAVDEKGPFQTSLGERKKKTFCLPRETHFAPNGVQATQRGTARGSGTCGAPAGGGGGSVFRKQCVETGDYQSRCLHVVCGVPQGSVLGP